MTSRTRMVLTIGVVALLTLVTAPLAHGASQRTIEWFHRQTLNWQACQQEAELQCADVVVPLDYANPGGKTITVAVSRLAATDRRHRIGAMLLNDGGPGGPGIGMPPEIREYLGALGSRYDLIGMDPRFVGESTPLDCHWPTGIPLRSAGPDRGSFEASVRFFRTLAGSCAEHGGDVLAHVSTRNTARDMDVIRAVLGERKISYLGYSYGTYLGAVYLELFGGRADRVVLDGPVDPDTYGPTMLRTTGAVNEMVLGDWANWAAARHATYRLGDTRERVLATVRRTIDAAARTPLRIGEYAVDASIAPAVLYAGLGDDRDEPRNDLALAVRAFADAAEHGSATPPPWLEEALGGFLTGAESQSGSAQAAILCGDVAASRHVERYWQEVQRNRAKLPFFGPLVNNIGPCAFWPTQPREAPTRIHNGVPALIVAATGDPRTIYPNADALRHKLTNTRLITLRGANRHGVYGEYANPCVDTAVNAYLASGRLPTTDLTCTK